MVVWYQVVNYLSKSKLKTIIKIGFKPKKGISNAIEDIIRMYGEGKIKNKPINHSVKWLKKVFNKN